MRTKSLLSFVVVVLATVVFAVGCQKPTESAGGSHDHDHGEHDHDHGDHGHSHAAHDHPPHGPNHGHIFELDSDEFTGEWCKYPDNNVIRFFLLDGKGKSPKSLVVEQFLVKPLTGSEGEPFELEPEDVDPEGAASSFMLDDQLLQIAIPLGVEIEVIADGQTLKGQIKAHEPLDH